MRGNCIPSDEVAKEIVERSTRVVSLDCLLSWEERDASYRFIEYTWKNVARTIYITITRARRRLYGVLSTLTWRWLKQKTHRRLHGPSHKKCFERGFGNCSVAAKCAKKSLWFYFPPTVREGEAGPLVKAKSNRYFPEADDDPRSLTLIINNESARKPVTNFFDNIRSSISRFMHIKL